MGVARLEPDEEIVLRLTRIALALPEVHQQDAWTGVRWRIRSATFAHVMVAQPGFESSFREATGIELPTTILTFRSAGEELVALRNGGLPFFPVGWSGNAVGMVLDSATDWIEVVELLTESYRIQAPKKLASTLD